MSRARKPPPPRVADWRGALAYLDRNRTVLSRSLDNATLVLGHDEDWRGTLAYDAFAYRVVKTAAPPCHALDEPDGGTLAGRWTDEDTLRTALWFARHDEYRMRLDPRTVEAAVRVVARQITRHPPREYLAGLAWDKTPRLDTWLADYCGAEPSDYVRAVGARTLIAAVRRVQSPGAKVDNVLVLEGAQGTEKSTAAKVLGGEWFSDTAFDPGHKDAFVALQGYWIIELGELDRMSKSEAGKIKAFVSSATDTYRPPYGRNVESFPRQCIFIGTCNHSEYLPDNTGNRRWWPVRVTRCDSVGLAIARDQLFAEARDRCLAGERHWMTADEERELCAPEQERRRQRDPWEEPIADYVRFRAEVTTREILSDVIERDVEHRTRLDEMRVAQVLQMLGFGREQRRSGGRREWVYTQASPTGTDRHQPPKATVGDEKAEAPRADTEPSPTAPTDAGNMTAHAAENDCSNRTGLVTVGDTPRVTGSNGVRRKAASV